MAAYNARLRYCKTGKAKYISHLDLMSTMRRALLRAGLKLAYSEGFNPHPHMSVALPLQVGCESDCELMDVGMEGDFCFESLPGLVSSALPEGLLVTEAYKPAGKFKDIAWVEHEGSLFYDSGAVDGIAARLEHLFSVSSIVVTKKTKRGEAELDISPHIRGISFSPAAGRVDVTASLSAQEPSVSPSLLISALVGDGLRPDFSAFRRTQVYDNGFTKFR